eukprot:TRINITY_DN2728_c0_g1_i1.p1 TRINITY_DN2728_c0_g1~~TRINITY_DN2728_c0_g1_i1.p1  ORF type:complete len:280 (+),score=75.31 TRINITY_DN2728_c0_g1_i1:56-895(+)
MSETSPKSAVISDDWEDEYKELIELFVDSDWQVVDLFVAKTSPGTSAKVANALLTLFTYKGMHMDMLYRAVDREIAQTPVDEIAFKNSFTTKLVQAFAKKVSKFFLSTVFGDLITRIGSMEFIFEVDPRRGSKLDCDANLKLLLVDANDILELWFSNGRSLPDQLRQLLAHIFHSLIQRESETAEDTILQFLFLQFLCPVVISPETVDMVDDAPTTSGRKVLVYCAKVLQNVVTGVPFPKQEAYLSELNILIERFSAELPRFVEEVLDVSGKIVEVPFS